MAIYPSSKKRFVKAASGVDTSLLGAEGTQSGGGGMSGAAGGMSAGIGLASSMANANAAKKRANAAKEDPNAPQQVDVGSVTLSGAAAGASLGTAIVPGWGTVIGGAVGAIAGFVGGTFASDEAKKELIQYNFRKEGRMVKELGQTSAGLYNSIGPQGRNLKAGGGIYPAKFGFSEASPTATPSIILGGKRHSEGGNPVIDTTTGEKKAETEAGELLLSKFHTDIALNLMKQHERGVKGSLDSLGNFVKTVVTTHMTDNAGKHQGRARVYPSLSFSNSTTPMVQLSGDGQTVEAPLEGAERIYSRTATNKILKLSAGNNVKALGQFMYKETKAQDKRKPEYTH